MEGSGSLIGGLPGSAGCGVGGVMGSLAMKRQVAATRLSSPIEPRSTQHDVATIGHSSSRRLE